MLDRGRSLQETVITGSSVGRLRISCSRKTMQLIIYSIYHDASQTELGRWPYTYMRYCREDSMMDGHTQRTICRRSRRKIGCVAVVRDADRLQSGSRTSYEGDLFGDHKSLLRIGEQPNIGHHAASQYATAAAASSSHRPVVLPINRTVPIHNPRRTRDPRQTDRGWPTQCSCQV